MSEQNVKKSITILINNHGQRYLGVKIFPDGNQQEELKYRK